MPHFSVRMLAENLDDTVAPRVIRSLTDAAVTVYGERFRPLVVVDLFAVPRRQWGIGGVPTEGNPIAVTLNLREQALVGDVPARLIKSITDAVADTAGGAEQVSVHLVGVPAGRSGVGGEVA